MTRMPVPIQAPLTEAPFDTLTCHLVLNDSYDTIELHGVFGALHKLEGAVPTPARLPLSVAV